MIRHFHDTILGDLPSGWTVHKLRDLLSADYPGDWGDDAGEVEVTCIRGTNFTAEGQLDLTKLARRFLPRKQAAIMQPKQGDIFLEKSGGGPDQPVARVGFVNRDLPNYAFSNFVHLLRPDPEAVMPAYLGRLLAAVYLSGVVVRMEQQTTGIRNLNLRDYLDVLLPLPSPGEQTAIARILDAADTAIERARVAVEKAGRIRVGILQRFFAAGLGKTTSADRHVGSLSPGWRLVRVSELLAESPKNGISPAASSQPPGLPTFSIAAVRNGRVNLSRGEHLKYVRLDSELTERFAIKRGDLLVVRGNANPDLVGRCGVVGDFPTGCIYPDILIRLVFKSGEDGLLPEYAATVWNHHLVHNQVFKRAKTSNGTLKINSQDVRRIVIPIPPRDEQVSLTKQLQHADAVISAQERRLTALERLKRGLMQDLLTGRVRVKTAAA